MYGVGQGLNEGVQMAAGFLTDAMKMKQQQNQFDALRERDYDRMALEQAWIDARALPPRLQSPHQAPTSEPPQAPAQAAPPAVPSPLASMGAAPRAQPQVTIRPMPMTMAQSLLPAQRFVAKPAREFMPSTMSASYPRWRR
ncbi:MAG TPA: hypothetical protein PKD12_17850 [Nitrospira sp.]|nr:hypothetical protein [Nitrospira sp.]